MSCEPKPDIVTSAAYHADTDDDDRPAESDYYDVDTDDEGFTAPSAAVDNDIINKCGINNREVCEETEAAREKGQMSASSVGRRKSTRKRKSSAIQEDKVVLMAGRPRKERTVSRDQKDCSVDTCENIAATGEPLYNVEEIVGYRCRNNREAEYLIKWVGYATEENTWERESNLDRGALGEAKRYRETKDAVNTGRNVPSRKKKEPLLEEEEVQPSERMSRNHRNRRKCFADGCTNKVVNGGVCVRHGAKLTQCSSDGCTNRARRGGVCAKHGAQDKLCSKEGCTNKAVNGGVCVRHGARVKLCSSVGCANRARRGGVCLKHGAEVKLCSSEGCANLAKRWGVCIRHGAKVKQCSRKG